MDVAIDETGENELPRGVDDFGAGLANFSISASAPTATIFVAANGHGLRPRLFWVFRVDAAVKHDRVGGAVVSRFGCVREHAKRRAYSKHTEAFEDRVERRNFSSTLISLESKMLAAC